MRHGAFITLAAAGALSLSVSAAAAQSVYGDDTALIYVESTAPLELVYDAMPAESWSEPASYGDAADGAGIVYEYVTAEPASHDLGGDSYADQGIVFIDEIAQQTAMETGESDGVIYSYEDGASDGIEYVPSTY